jgi:hypothetical protein
VQEAGNTIRPKLRTSLITDQAVALGQPEIARRNNPERSDDERTYAGSTIKAMKPRKGRLSTPSGLSKHPLASPPGLTREKPGREAREAGRSRDQDGQGTPSREPSRKSRTAASMGTSVACPSRFEARITFSSPT